MIFSQQRQIVRQKKRQSPITVDANQTCRKSKNEVVNSEANIVTKRTKTAKSLKLKQPTSSVINKADYLKQFNVLMYGHIH